MRRLASGSDAISASLRQEGCSQPDLWASSAIFCRIEPYSLQLRRWSCRCLPPSVTSGLRTFTMLNFLLWDDTTNCSRTVSSFWWEPLLGTLHFQPKRAIWGTNLADSAREFN